MGGVGGDVAAGSGVEVKRFYERKLFKSNLETGRKYSAYLRLGFFSGQMLRAAIEDAGND